ncbi:MAG: carbonic anhydrase [Acidobacteriota bacterium]
MPITELLSGYQKFKERLADSRESYLPTEGDQKPYALWIGCSDSRVIPEQITNARPGELFVMRTIANIVPPFGVACDAVGAVIEYAVLHLKVHEIVVCGHTECGGIKALEKPVDLAREPHVARWVEFARPARARVEASGVAVDRQYLDAIRANVLLQRDNLSSYNCVRDALRTGALRIDGWMYNTRTGQAEEYDDKSEQWIPL